MRRTVNSEKQQCFQTAIAFSAAVGGPRTLGTQLWAPAAPRARGRLGRPQALSLTREVRASVLLRWGAFAPQGTSNDDRGQGHAVGEAGVLPATLQAPGQPQTPTVPGQRDPGLGHPTALPVREHAGFRFKSPIVPRLSLPSAVAFLTRGGTPCP